MSILGIKTGDIGGIALGAGAVLAAPIAVAMVSGAMKPLAKNLIKGGMIAYSRTRLALAETMETLEDIAAEARMELAQSNGQGGNATETEKAPQPAKKEKEKEKKS